MALTGIWRWLGGYPNLVPTRNAHEHFSSPRSANGVDSHAALSSRVAARDGVIYVGARTRIQYCTVLSVKVFRVNANLPREVPWEVPQPKRLDYYWRFVCLHFQLRWQTSKQTSETLGPSSMYGCKLRRVTVRRWSVYCITQAHLLEFNSYSAEDLDTTAVFLSAATLHQHPRNPC